jgi:hypothetical protein
VKRLSWAPRFLIGSQAGRADASLTRGESALSRRPRAYLIFTGTGPILVLSTYPKLTDERLVEKLRYKGIDKFLAYEVELEAVKVRYPESFEGIIGDLEEVEDIRVLDFNGHQIMSNFSLEELGDPIKFGN